MQAVFTAMQPLGGVRRDGEEPPGGGVAMEPLGSLGPVTLPVHRVIILSEGGDFLGDICRPFPGRWANDTGRAITVRVLGVYQGPEGAPVEWASEQRLFLQPKDSVAIYGEPTITMGP